MARTCSGSMTTMLSGWYQCACMPTMPATVMPHRMFLRWCGLTTEAMKMHKRQERYASGMSNSSKRIQNIFCTFCTDYTIRI